MIETFRRAEKPANTNVGDCSCPLCGALIGIDIEQWLGAKKLRCLCGMSLYYNFQAEVTGRMAKELTNYELFTLEYASH